MSRKKFEINFDASAKELLDRHCEAKAKEPGLTFVDFTDRISWKN